MRCEMFTTLALSVQSQRPVTTVRAASKETSVLRAWVPRRFPTCAFCPEDIGAALRFV